MRKVFAGALTCLVLLGAGCSVPFLPADKAAEDIDLRAGSTILLEQTYLGLTLPGAPVAKKVVTLNEWNAGASAKMTWAQTDQKETQASIDARAAAMNSPVGSGVKVPDPVYEDIVTTGSLTTDGLGEADRVYLPSYWSAKDEDLNGKKNSLLWLSKTQYDQLVNSRQTNVELGLFDGTLSSIQGFSQDVQNAIAAIRGQQTTPDTAQSDMATITAQGDWGSKTLKLNGQNVKVKTVEAENAFAQYTILANPDNPLILKVTLRPWAFGSSFLETMNVLQSLVGYDVTEIKIE